MEDEERTTFKSAEVTVMVCTAGNFDHYDGEPATIVTLARRDDKIEPIVLNLRDTRFLAVGLLVSLYTANDQFAEKVLDAMFPHDKGGRYHWPKQSEGVE